MTVGRRQYNEAEMLQMQRDAEERVREMQSRVRKTVEHANQNGRGWQMPSNVTGQRPHRRPLSASPPEPKPDSSPPPPPEPEGPEPKEEAMQPKDSIQQKKEGTLVGDIMDALGLDDDVLLIVGLILILINQRADTTLILALAYLLI